jgi:hypothetical protein
MAEKYAGRTLSTGGPGRDASRASTSGSPNLNYPETLRQRAEVPGIKAKSIGRQFRQPPRRGQTSRDHRTWQSVVVRASRISAQTVHRFVVAGLIREARRDPRDLALTMAPDAIKGALVSLLNGLKELASSDNPALLLDEVALILRRRLDRLQRRWLLWVAATAAEPEDAASLASSVLEEKRNHGPIPELDDVREEARLWASWATRAQLRAYMAACWGALPVPERNEFLRAVRASI